MASSTETETGFINRDRWRQTEENRVFITPSPPGEVCGIGGVKPVVQGKFYVIGQLGPTTDYQADSASSGLKKNRGQRLDASEELSQRLQPVVECGDAAMTLTVRRRRAAQLLLDRVNESSVPLSQLPPHCGYSVQTTWRDLSLMARYDACHVTQKDDSYVLPLLWRETPVKMSCPASQIQSPAVSFPSVCCFPLGMTVKVQAPSDTELLRVNVRGEWTPLVALVERCGYTMDRRDTDLVIAAPFITCGITVKDGKYILSLQIGPEIFTMACPVSSTEEPPLIQELPDSSPHKIGGPAEHKPESRDSFPWSPPFYLAPPYYPHPIYHYKYPNLDRHNAYNAHSSPPSTPDPTFVPQTHAHGDSKPEYENYISQVPLRDFSKHFDLQSSQSSIGDTEDSSQVYPTQQETPFMVVFENSSTHSSLSDAGFPNPTEVSSLQPPSHAFNQYYHYYHHPKIPLPDPPHGPSPVFPTLINDHKLESPVLPPSVHIPEALSRFNVDRPASHPYTIPKNVPFPVQPYAYHYLSYLPNIATVEAKKMTFFDPDTPAGTDLSNQNTKSTFHQSFRSSDLNNNYKLHSYDSQSKANKMTSPDWFEHPPLSDEGNAELMLPGPDTDVVSPSGQTVILSPNHNLPPYIYYYHPYHYYQMSYRPESSLGNARLAALTSSGEVLAPLPPQHPPYHRPQIAILPAKAIYDVHPGPVHPYYNPNDQPKESAEKQDLHHTGSLRSQSDFWMHWLAHAAEVEYPNMPQESPFYAIHPYDVTGQHPYNPIGHPDGKVAVELLYNEMRDCSLGQHFIFAVLDSMVEATVQPSFEGSNMSCALQRLISDPDIYIVPLDGCGINKHMSGGGVGHLLDVHSFQQDYGSVFEGSPVSTFPGSEGEARLHVVSQPLQPPTQSTAATVTVHMRIATDESFTSFHPEAHLSLSLIQGRLVYVEVSLLDPPEPGLVLLVYSCLAYTQAADPSWMFVYDGCPSWSHSQLLPSPNPDHIRRILVASFLSLPSDSPTNVANQGYPHLEDPEIFFLCLTEVCSAADGDCTVGCISSKFNTEEI